MRNNASNTTFIDVAVKSIFGLVALIIILAIAGVFFQAASTGLRAANGQSTLTYGVGGIVETRCIDNYKFIIGQDGNVRQVMDSFGRGVQCNSIRVEKATTEENQ